MSDRGREVACLGDHVNTVLARQQQTQIAPYLALIVGEHNLDVPSPPQANTQNCPGLAPTAGSASWLHASAARP
jgi:hypothetical protein